MAEPISTHSRRQTHTSFWQNIHSSCAFCVYALAVLVIGAICGIWKLCIALEVPSNALSRKYFQPFIENILLNNKTLYPLAIVSVQHIEQ